MGRGGIRRRVCIRGLGTQSEEGLDSSEGDGGLNFRVCRITICSSEEKAMHA